MSSKETSSYDTYVTPLTNRYASQAMSFNFSERKRISTWRKLWLYLAKSQHKLGISYINTMQLEEMEQNIHHIDFEAASREEKLTKHDVMAHLKVFSQASPKAGPIIHLGATSCYLTDNADLIVIRDAFDIIIPKLLYCIKIMSSLADKFKSIPTLGMTHFQPATLTTVGKRICIWMADLVEDFNKFFNMRNSLKFRGCKGAVGTQATYLTLFDGDFNKVQQLDEMVTKMAGFESTFAITGQTYSRKSDVDVIMILSSFGSSVHKICTDIRLLCGLQEMREPFDHSTQVGSSAMPYKQNPTRCERCCGLSRHLTTLTLSMTSTHSTQWLERSLDDSSNRRIVIPEAFLIADILLESLSYIFEGLTIYPVVIKNRIQQQLPLLSSEFIIIELTNHGRDRQECHERIRIHAQKAIEINKVQVSSVHPFVEAILSDPFFQPIHNDIQNLFDPLKYIGASVHQVDSYIENVVNLILQKNAHLIPPNVHQIQI